MTEFKTGDRVVRDYYDDDPGTVVGMLNGEVWVRWDADTGDAWPYKPDELRLLPAPWPHLWINVYGDGTSGGGYANKEVAEQYRFDRICIGVIEVGDHLPGGVKLHDLRDGGK